MAFAGCTLLNEGVFEPLQHRVEVHLTGSVELSALPSPGCPAMQEYIHFFFYSIPFKIFFLFIKGMYMYLGYKAVVVLQLKMIIVHPKLVSQ